MLTKLYGARALMLTAALALPASVMATGEKFAEGQWQRIDNPGPVRGIDGKMHAASCSGYPGTDPRFSFWARKGKSRNLAIYFEGGGACWDNLTCSLPVAGLPAEVPQFFVPQVPPDTDPAKMDGMFRNDPANPVRDWDMVYIPYCTGDIHTGSARKEYTSVGHPVFPLLAGTPFAIEHRGFDNFMVVLDWLRRNIKSPHKVLVTGSSAGGYGATANAPWVGLTFPSARMHVLADASQGVTSAGFDGGNPGRLSWNPQLAPWVFGKATVPGNKLMRRLAQSDPWGRYGQFTTALDTVQVGFYGLMKRNYGPSGNCPNPAVDWNQQAVAQITRDASTLFNYRHYVAAGTYHTIMRSPQFYTENSAGPTFASWVTGMLSRRGDWWWGGSWRDGDSDAEANDVSASALAASTQRHGHAMAWRNEACPGCLVTLPCQ